MNLPALEIDLSRFPNQISFKSENPKILIFTKQTDNLLSLNISKSTWVFSWEKPLYKCECSLSNWFAVLFITETVDLKIDMILNITSVLDIAFAA